MTVVDSHCHASPYWFEPVEALLFHMNTNGVERATLVQFMGQPNNSYLIECSVRFPGRFSPVVFVDADRSDATEILRRWVREGAEGVRFRPRNRSPGEDPLAIWLTCGELGLPVSCRGSQEDYASEEFRKLVQALPHVPLIIEHLGNVRKDEPPPYDTYRKALALARFPNTYIKLGSLGKMCGRPQPFREPDPLGAIPPFVKMAYESFGPKRMLWESNYPPCSRIEGYGNTLRYFRKHLETFCGQEDMQWIFGKTALSLFKFGRNTTGSPWPCRSPSSKQH